MAKLSYQPGSEVFANGTKGTIEKVLDTDRLLVHLEGTKEPKVLQRTDLSAVPDNEPKRQVRDAIAHEDLKEAENRFTIIKPLLGQRVKGRDDLEKVAEETGYSVPTIYRWLSDYKDNGTLSSLAPKRKGSQRGQRRTKPEIEAIVEDRIQNDFLKRQRIKKTELHRLIANDCKSAGYPAPGYATICRRIDEVSEFEKMKKRRGPKQASERYGGAPDTYEEAQFPLSVVQIDHTQLNIMVVNSEDRVVIGRPWITLAIDVYSRMITGLYLSLDAPSANSVGLCLTNSILEKEGYLQSVNVDGKWPVWGLMHILHCDNAKEFRGKMLQEFCKEWGITLQWRAVGKPEWGAHIERMNGTLKSFLDNLDGTTFRGPQDRREYDSEAKATFTLDELETILVTHIVNVYHQKVHKTLKMPPIKAWNNGILGDHGCGLPEPVSDEKKLRLELLPMTERTIQRNGISWDNINYFDNCLRPWIKSKDRGKARKFLVRRDPRNISCVYFFDPKLKEYIKVPYRNKVRPVISLWDLRAAKKRLEDSNRETNNEDIIFRAHEEIERLKEVASKDTKKARKTAEQRKRDKRS
ncbi:MAG: transposase, partial [Methylocystaceae bacterium]|nr:transposase [Methylocystaceae bacterium]